MVFEHAQNAVHTVTQRLAVGATIAAVAACVEDVGHNPIPRYEPGDVISHGMDNTCRLVPHDERQNRFIAPTGLNVQISRANSTRFGFDQYFIRAWYRRGHFLEAV